MAKFEIIMPKLGESIIEATITKWLKAEGDQIEEDDAIAEIATDKVDSEIPSPVEGKISKILYEEGATVAVGEVIAVIQMDGDGDDDDKNDSDDTAKEDTASETVETVNQKEAAPEVKKETGIDESARFYSPLVKSIARKEGISLKQLDEIEGSGKEGRVTKNDIIQYIESGAAQKGKEQANVASPTPLSKEQVKPGIQPPVTSSAGDQIIEMDRMRKLIADHMVASVHTSPHVTSFVEVDMTNIVNWRNKNKDNVQARESEKLTFTHIFVEAMARAIKDYPMVNASVDGHNMIIRKDVNIGIAVALPTGNLIVPVLKSADQKNLLGIIKGVNSLADKARNNKLQPDDIQGGTITLTNLGSFGTIFGTPIINQPQVGIVAVGAITKRPVVLETAEGDVIAIRHMMYMSLSYDHRIVDGQLGGLYIHRVKEYLENFDINRSI